MTALQIIIQQLHKKLDAFPDDMNLSQRGLYDGYLNAMNMATSLLETEKQQLNIAFSKGIINGILPIGKEIMDLSKTYYDNTY